MTEELFLSKIKAHERIIHKLLYLYVDLEEDKRDLYQEIVLQAWKSILNFKGKSQFSTWLYRVSLNTILTYARKTRRIPQQGLDEAMLMYETPDELSDNAQRLFSAIKSLHDVDKTIITLHLDEYNNDEICEIMGITKNHVAVKIHRIKEQLKSKLQHNG